MPACTNLELLDAYGLPLTDLSIFKGMKLKTLVIGASAVADLSPLAGMPLTYLRIDGTPVKDVSPLVKCPTLKVLILPSAAENIKLLHELSHLERISFKANSNNDPDMTADQFWESVADKAELPLAALDKAKITYTTRRLQDRSWELILDHQPITDLAVLKGALITRLSMADAPVTDLSPLRGMKLTYLRISGTNVSDLSPIQGMPITNLTMTGTGVHDLTPLAGMPLRGLYMGDCKQITDLSPLADMTTLDSITLPPGAKNIDFLRNFPKLNRIGYKSDKNTPQTAAEFWAEYDHKAEAATKSATTKPAAD